METAVQIYYTEPLIVGGQLRFQTQLLCPKCFAEGQATGTVAAVDWDGPPEPQRVGEERDLS